MTPALEPLRRIAAYGICLDPQAGVLLVRAAPHAGTPLVWSLPGGGVDHGEDPRDTVLREVRDETGLDVRVTGLRDVVSDLRALPTRGIALHTDRLLYTVEITGGALRDRVHGNTDLARWYPVDEAAALPLRPFTALSLDLEPAGVDLRPDEQVELPSFLIVPGPGGRHRVQRFAAYALAADPAGRVLLTRIAEGYPGAGLWHLPGGGVDYGEQPGIALLREVVEETGQHGELGGLLGVTSHVRDNQVGPEGYPIDWHGVRAVYRVTVATPTEPLVTEAHGGSTAAARWFTLAELAGLEVSEVTEEALGEAGLR